MYQIVGYLPEPVCKWLLALVALVCARVGMGQWTCVVVAPLVVLPPLVLALISAPSNRNRRTQQSLGFAIVDGMHLFIVAGDVGVGSKVIVCVRICT